MATTPNKANGRKNLRNTPEKAPDLIAQFIEGDSESTANNPAAAGPGLDGRGSAKREGGDRVEGVDSRNVSDLVAGIITDDKGDQPQSNNTQADSNKENKDEPLEEIDPEFLNDFLVETNEHIENIEMNVLALETDPGNIEMINGLFRSFHTIKGLAGFVNQDLVRKIAHQTETRLDKCRKGEAKVSKHFVDLILASSDFLKKLCEDLSLSRNPGFLSAVEDHLANLNREDVEAGQPVEGSSEYQALKVDKLGEILIHQGLDSNTVDDLLSKQDQYPGLKLGQVAVKEKKAEPQKVIQSLRIQEKASSVIANESGAGYTRVPTFKIDNLVDMMGELLINQSLIEREASQRFDANDPFIGNLLRMEKITKDIQNIAMSLRMVTLKSTFQKVNRIGRDAIAELGKNILLQFAGEDTEIDRGVTEKLLDPLLHLVKNSIAHGIEDEATRIANNKPAQGLVKVQAFSKRGTVYIEVSDDGKGLTLDKIYQKAKEKGLVDPSREYSEEEISHFIFLPGFSTADNVNNVSGRGVGLDVVKTEVSKVGGKVEINNRPGSGCSFILKIPINLAAINGTIVDIAGSNYIIPTHFIKQILRPDESQWISIQGKQTMIRVKEAVFPVIPIAKLLGREDLNPQDNEGLIVILELDQKFKALPVRSVIERREIVVKSLGSEFNQLAFLAGASILGDGKVSLIFDVENLFKFEEAVS